MKTFVVLLLLFSLLGCKSKEVDPRQQILGKWEEAYKGNGDDLTSIKNPLAYLEFRGDSVLVTHEYATGREFFEIYWVDSLLHRGHRRQDGTISTMDYEYRFRKDEIRLDYVSGSAINYTSVYRRID